MSEPDTIPTPEGESARGVRSLGKFLGKYGAMIALLSTPLQVAGGYYLHNTFQTKAEAKASEERQDAKTEANKQLIYDRTRPMNERIGVLESQYKTIETKLDGAGKIADERAKHQEENDADMKRSLHQIEDLLMRPPAR